jgi:hypothetical protein
MSAFNVHTSAKTILTLALIAAYVAHVIRLQTKLPDNVELFGANTFSYSAHLLGYVSDP